MHYSHRGSIKFLTKVGGEHHLMQLLFSSSKRQKQDFCNLQETKLSTAYCRQYCLVVIAAFGICLSLE